MCADRWKADGEWIETCDQYITRYAIIQRPISSLHQQADHVDHRSPAKVTKR